MLSAIWTVYGSQAGVTEMGKRYEGVSLEGDIGVLALFETGLGDVEPDRVGFLPQVKPGSHGIRLMVLNKAPCL